MSYTTAHMAIVLARKNIGVAIQKESARFCLAHAVQAFDGEYFDTAHRWARKSLAYSVGIGHPDYVITAPTITHKGALHEYTNLTDWESVA